MRLKHWPILISSGLLWGIGVVILALVPAGALYQSSRPGSLAVIALGVILGLAVFIRWVRCFIEVTDDHLDVQGVFGHKTYALADVQEVRAALPKADSSGVVRSPFVLVYPYLGLSSGHRVRLTPGGSFCLNLLMKDVDVSATSANEVATTLRNRLPQTPSGV
jgi:hypothetical protein